MKTLIEQNVENVGEILIAQCNYIKAQKLDFNESFMGFDNDALLSALATIYLAESTKNLG